MAIWLGLSIIVLILGAGSSKEENLKVAGGFWLLVVIGIYTWKVWRKRESPLKKILLGILVWILVSMLGGSVAIFGFPEGFGYLLIAYVFLISNLYEEK